MTKDEIIEYLYMLHVHADITIEDIAEDLAQSEEQESESWIFEEYPDGYYHTECPICGEWFDEEAYKKWNYCPNCGKKML